MGAVMIQDGKLKVLVPTGSATFGFEEIGQAELLLSAVALGIQELRVLRQQQRRSRRRR